MQPGLKHQKHHSPKSASWPTHHAPTPQVLTHLPGALSGFSAPAIQALAPPQQRSVEAAGPLQALPAPDMGLS